MNKNALSVFIIYHNVRYCSTIKIIITMRWLYVNIPAGNINKGIFREFIFSFTAFVNICKPNYSIHSTSIPQ